jgi:hypothetical protein
MRGFGGAALALACCWLVGAHAQEREQGRQQQREQGAAPDLDFLEYLGAWAEGDDEWLAIETWRKENAVDAEDAKDPKDPKDAKESETERDDDDESK